MNIVGKSVNDLYLRACGQLVVSGREVAGTHELRNVSLTLLDITDSVCTLRPHFSIPYMLGELAWYFLGRDDVAFISHFSSMWARISDDGVTSNSAYGDIIFCRYGYNQVEQVIKILTDDPDSRRAVINFNAPNPCRSTTKDDPCTIALEFAIRDGALVCTCMMRSNDIYLGTPYDIAFFTTLQRYIADRLGVTYGTYTHFAVSLHVYDRNWDQVRSVWVGGRGRVAAAPKIKIDTQAMMRAISEFGGWLAGADVNNADVKRELVETVNKNGGLEYANQD